MATQTEEKKLSIAMQKCMDRLSFEPEMVVLDFLRRDTNMQTRMMDLIMTFLNRWAADFETGVHREGDGMYRLGEMSQTMLASLTATQGGRHGQRPVAPRLRRGPGILP